MQELLIKKVECEMCVISCIVALIIPKEFEIDSLSMAYEITSIECLVKKYMEPSLRITKLLFIEKS